MRKIVIGLLTRVSGNINANEVDGDRIRIKKLVSTNGEIYPFVSARAVKRGIREKLGEVDGIEVDPFRVGEGGKLADSGDPVKYTDNDLFGYLYIQGTSTQKPRQAPISLSPIIALEHTPIEVDFGGRFPKEPGSNNPTPFETEVADFIGLLKVVITERIGIFTENEKTDQIKEWDEYVNEGKVSKQGAEDIKYVFDDTERIKRVKSFLEILLNEGWVYPRKTNYLAMADHSSAIVYAGEKLYPIWKAHNNYKFEIKNVPYQIEQNTEFLEAYELKNSIVPSEDVEKLASWLVNGKWKQD